MTTEFQRARSAEAKQQREQAILAAAARLGAERGIRQVTLTDIAEVVGMHKSALLRYFETREQIFLRLTAAGWQDWGPDLRAHLARIAQPAPTAQPAQSARLAQPTSAGIATAFAATLTARPMFCDLLAQAPLNLERNVSLEAVRAFKLVTLEEVARISTQLRQMLPGLTDGDAVDVIAAATSMAGAFWQMATPGPLIEQLCRADPRLAHAVVEVEPRLVRILTAQLTGLLAR